MSLTVTKTLLSGKPIKKLGLGFFFSVSGLDRGILLGRCFLGLRFSEGLRLRPGCGRATQ